MPSFAFDTLRYNDIIDTYKIMHHFSKINSQFSTVRILLILVKTKETSSLVLNVT